MPRIVCCLALLLMMTTAAADGFKLITVRNRSVDELIALISPMLRPDERVSGMGDQLIISANPSRQDELERLIAQLDAPAARLLISVMQAGQDERREHSVGASGTVIAGQGGAVVIGAQSRSLRSSDSINQQVQTLDGGIAQINVGNTRLIQQPIRIGNRISTQTDMLSAETGFYVRPRLQGEQVVLEIAVSREALDRYGVAGQQVTTTVRGRLGEWVTVGGVDRSASGQSGALLGAGERSIQQQGTVRLKVERLPD